MKPKPKRKKKKKKFAFSAVRKLTQCSDNCGDKRAEIMNLIANGITLRFQLELEVCVALIS